MPAAWPQEEVNYLMDNWGVISISSLGKNLNKSENAVMIKAQKLGLGAFLESGEYVTANQLFKAIGRNGAWTYTLNQWNKKGFPLKKKKVLNNSFKIVYLEEFWKWAKEYRMHIDFNKFKENALGKEPAWVREQRKADIAFAKYKVTPWTSEEDNKLISLLRLYKYTYKEISMKLLRTEGAIKRRCNDLLLIERPLRESPHNTWTSEQEQIVIEMYNKGYKSDVIKEYIDKSGLAINGKIERLIKEGRLIKWH